MTYESAHERAGKLKLLRHRARRLGDSIQAAAEPETIQVRLGEEDLKLSVCGSCYSLVLRRHWDLHVAWHERLAAHWHGKNSP